MRRKMTVLASMRNGQSGKISVIEGGIGMTARLDALGIRIGSRIVKKSALLACGPVVVAVGGTEIAMGHGMAARITVEVEE